MSVQNLDCPTKITNRPYWITRKDQIECLVSAVRTDIVDHLASTGPLSIKELAHQIGMKPSALYHHFELLLDVDLIHEAGTQVANRKSEKLYATPSRRMRMIKALGDPDNADEMRKMVSALARRAERDFSNGLDHEKSKTTGPARNLGYYRIANRPDKETLREVNQKFEEIAELLWRDPDPSQPLLSLAWVMAPIDTD